MTTEKVDKLRDEIKADQGVLHSKINKTSEDIASIKAIYEEALKPGILTIKHDMKEIARETRESCQAIAKGLQESNTAIIELKTKDKQRQKSFKLFVTGAATVVAAIVTGAFALIKSMVTGE